MSGNTQVVLEGKGPVTLRDSNYVATGGEGTIYRISDLVVKVYHEPEKARLRGVPEKIRTLSRLRHPFVGTPVGLVTDPKGDVVGHYLPYVDGHPLSRVFTNEFWQKEGFGINHASTLVSGMREVISFAHQNSAVLVDANELNWFALLSGKTAEPRVIDVDSWAIGRWPATVIMPSIRDWHSKTFGVQTDWFAWGIVTFQIYTGIHPYKGTLDGFDRGNLEARMKANASVFTKGVRLNRAVRDLTKIPSALLNWYEAVFQNGKRETPPSPFDTQVSTPQTAHVVHAVTIGKTGILVFEKIAEFKSDPVIETYHCGVVRLFSDTLVDLSTRREITTVDTRKCHVVKKGSGWLIAEIQNQRIRFKYVEEGSMKTTLIATDFSGHDLVSFENRLFVVTDRGLSEVNLTILGKPIVSIGQTWGAMVNSTKWFSGVGVMDALGAKYLVLPFGDKAVTLERVKELDSLRVLDGRSGNRFVSLVCIDKKGNYKKVEVTFDRDYKSHKVSIYDTDSPELNLAILPKGVCATIIRDGEVDIFVPTTGQVTRIEDNHIGTDMSLSNWGDRVIFIQDGVVWSLRMK